MSEAPSVDALLRSTLDRVDGWLKFAEAKNLAIVALSGTATAALTGFLRGSDLQVPVAALITGAEISFLLGLATAMLGFLPQTALGQVLSRPLGKVDHESDNLFFYGDLQKYAPAELAAAIARRYAGAADYDPGAQPLHLDLAAQITANARITVRKLRAFTYAARLVLLGVLLVGSGLLVRLAIG